MKSQVFTNICVSIVGVSIISLLNNNTPKTSNGEPRIIVTDDEMDSIHRAGIYGSNQTFFGQEYQSIIFNDELVDLDSVFITKTSKPNTYNRPAKLPQISSKTATEPVTGSFSSSFSAHELSLKNFGKQVALIETRIPCQPRIPKPQPTPGPVPEAQIYTPPPPPQEPREICVYNPAPDMRNQTLMTVNRMLMTLKQIISKIMSLIKNLGNLLVKIFHVLRDLIDIYMFLNSVSPIKLHYILLSIFALKLIRVIITTIYHSIKSVYNKIKSVIGYLLNIPRAIYGKISTIPRTIYTSITTGYHKTKNVTWSFIGFFSRRDRTTRVIHKIIIALSTVVSFMIDMTIIGIEKARDQVDNMIFGLLILFSYDFLSQKVSTLYQAVTTIIGDVSTKVYRAAIHILLTSLSVYFIWTRPQSWVKMIIISIVFGVFVCLKFNYRAVLTWSFKTFKVVSRLSINVTCFSVYNIPRCIYKIRQLLATIIWFVLCCIYKAAKWLSYCAYRVLQVVFKIVKVCIPYV